MLDLLWLVLAVFIVVFGIRAFQDSAVREKSWGKFKAFKGISGFTFSLNLGVHCDHCGNVVNEPLSPPVEEGGAIG